MLCCAPKIFGDLRSFGALADFFLFLGQKEGGVLPEKFFVLALNPTKFQAEPLQHFN